MRDARRSARRATEARTARQRQIRTASGHDGLRGRRLWRGTADSRPTSISSLRELTTSGRRLLLAALSLFSVILVLGLSHSTASANCDQPLAGSVTVQDGDTLRSIARAYYGAESCASIIAQANFLSTSDDLHAGESLVLAATTPAATGSNVHYSWGISDAPKPSSPTPTPSPTPPTGPNQLPPTAGISSGTSSAVTAIPIFSPPVLAPASAPDSRSSNGFIWPLLGPITQPFGVPELGVGSPHTGIDIGVPSGSPVHAAQAGRVTFAGGDACCGLGYWIEINHGNRYATRYGHFMRPPLLLPGDFVQQGQVIGFSGTTGFSTGPHLHFEIRLDGNPINPLWLLPHVENSDLARGDSLP